MRVIAILALALLAALGLSGCAIGATSGDDGPPAVQPIEERDNPGSVSSEGEDQSYVGRTVTVTGAVQEIYADGLFSVATATDDFDLDRTDAGLLVVAPDAQIAAGQEVEISGQIQIFSADDAARLAGTALSAEQALSLEGRLMIIAESVSPAGGS